MKNKRLKRGKEVRKEVEKDKVRRGEKRSEGGREEDEDGGRVGEEENEEGSRTRRRETRKMKDSLPLLGKRKENRLNDS